MNTDQQIWAYCHGQMDADQRSDFEKKCLEQPELMRERRIAEWMERRLNAAYHTEAIDEEQLTDKVLDEMRQDPAMEKLLNGHSEHHHLQLHKPMVFVRMVSLAAAAGVVAMLSWWPQPAGQLSLSSDLTAVARRSVDGTDGGPLFAHCTQEEAAQFVNNFEAALTKSYRDKNRRPLLQQWVSREQPRDVEVILQEIRAGQIHLRIVTGKGAGPDQCLERYFQSLDRCYLELESLADEVAEWLSASDSES